MKDFTNIMAFIPTRQTFIIVEEGSGDNLFPEDIEAGYVDYLNYYTYSAEDFFYSDTVTSDDGGMIMYKELIQEKFNDLEETIPDVIKDIFEEKLDYKIITRS